MTNNYFNRTFQSPISVLIGPDID